ncbi:Multiple organellar RNA editing factor 8 [Nymphaea thermarum]|nr:Multiple organellar RNA editing factor 8 [Nymphaea thermarum]
MASAILGRSLLLRRALVSWRPSPVSSFSTVAGARPSRFYAGFSVRSLAALQQITRVPAAMGVRCMATTRPTTSSLNDSSPNWSNRPPKETILLDGCDFEHWLIVMEPPEGNPTRDEIIDSYIKTLAQVLGSEDEARKSIYSVSTRHYFAFGCKVSEELSYKIKPLPKVRWVLPDSYLDVKNKDYGGEPFIDGKAVPYDPKYHEEWVRNNARANERSRRNDRPRNFDRSRNFERRRQNMQSQDFQSRDMPPMPNRDFQNPPPPNAQQGMQPPGPPPMPNRDFQNPPPPNAQQGMQPPGPPPMPNRDFQNPPPPNAQQGMPPPGRPPMPSRDFQNPNPYNQNAMPPRDMPAGDQGYMPNRDFQSRDMGGNFQNRDMGNMPPNNYQGGYQGNNYQGYGYQGNNMPNRDTPPPPNRDFPPMPNRDYQ